jgi:hypothetical protein
MLTIKPVDDCGHDQNNRNLSLNRPPIALTKDYLKKSLPISREASWGEESPYFCC